MALYFTTIQSEFNFLEKIKHPFLAPALQNNDVFEAIDRVI